MGSSVDWWRTFFSDWVVDGWLAAATEEQTAQEAAFIQEQVGISPPARLLDVPCGGGRHSRALARLGYDMTGVDLSADFLDAARSQPSAGPGSVAWEQREMRDLPWPERFDGAFSFGNSFGYLDDQGNADFFKAVARAPQAGGALRPRDVLRAGVPLVQPPTEDLVFLRRHPLAGRSTLRSRRRPAPRRVHQYPRWEGRQEVDVARCTPIARSSGSWRRPASPT